MSRQWLGGDPASVAGHDPVCNTLVVHELGEPFGLDGEAQIGEVLARSRDIVIDA